MPDPADLVVRLRGAGIENADAGGKGSALDRLVSVGANVPVTSVVTTAAYQLFVSDPAISTLIEELITGELPPPEDHPAEQERVDQAFLQVDLPPSLIEAMAELGQWATLRSALRQIRRTHGHAPCEFAATSA